MRLYYIFLFQLSSISIGKYAHSFSGICNRGLKVGFDGINRGNVIVGVRSWKIGVREKWSDRFDGRCDKTLFEKGHFFVDIRGEHFAGSGMNLLGVRLVNSFFFTLFRLLADKTGVSHVPAF